MVLAPITIHSSQFPDQIRQDLLESLRRRQVNHKFHYDSVKQAQKWLALHEAYSPSRTDPDCIAIYERAFEAVRDQVQSNLIHLVGLGCGGGQKDARLLKLLREFKKTVWYTPCDVSTAMVLTARRAAVEFVDEERCFPLVCDLATAADLNEVIDNSPEQRRDPSYVERRSATRLVALFGILPNFEPQSIVTCLGAVLRPGDWLLISANLSPGDYATGIERILPLYDNQLTREWLLTFLFDLGVERSDGDLRFQIEEIKGLRRVAAYFHFANERQIQMDADCFEFRAGDSIRLFFSYRHTPELVKSFLEPLGCRVITDWMTRSGEEGVFLVNRLGQDGSPNA